MRIGVLDIRSNIGISSKLFQYVMLIVPHLPYNCVEIYVLSHNEDKY